MIIVVTGATGFLGSALVTELLKRQQPGHNTNQPEKGSSTSVGARVAEQRGWAFMVARGVGHAACASTIYHLAGRFYHPRRRLTR